MITVLGERRVILSPDTSERVAGTSNLRLCRPGQPAENTVDATLFAPLPPRRSLLHEGVEPLGHILRGEGQGHTVGATDNGMPWRSVGPSDASCLPSGGNARRSAGRAHCAVRGARWRSAKNMQIVELVVDRHRVICHADPGRYSPERPTDPPGALPRDLACGTIAAPALVEEHRRRR